MKPRTISFTLNGEPREVMVCPNDLLLNVIRDHELLKGTKYGCGIGECGTCTVQVDGKPVLSCLTLAVAADGCQVVTIEGLAGGGRLDPVQEAFLDHAAVQCGFCTPGMIMTSRSLLDEIPQPTEEEVREYLRGCLCRCTGYASIVRAVLSVVEKGA
ncbi:MAG: (2Fe-2S)-binding protein [Rhodospirillales bacterium]|jgi:carbon-monoxide dehydrogenase small subunit|nr:(2Fe-2S)-binding protein [Rhodospirillales bacterium]HJO73573.1 (2Fe-2S)-binding protein [Rhodospirillales bacterium]